MCGGAGSYGVCPDPGLKLKDRGKRLALCIKSGKLDWRKRAPTSKFREVPVGNSRIPAPESLSDVFQGAMATCRFFFLRVQPLLVGTKDKGNLKDATYPLVLHQ